MTTDTPQDDAAPEAAAESVDATAGVTLPEHPLAHGLGAAFPEVSWDRFEPVVGPAQDIATVPRDQLQDFMATARERGYVLFVDLCAVDYLRRAPRYDVVVHVRAMSPPHLLRVRVGVAHDDPVVPSISGIYPGANFYEREAYDLFGIEFAGHPDLARILLPDDWEGHPLRKDYAVGSVPVQFKGAHKAT